MEFKQEIANQWRETAETTHAFFAQIPAEQFPADRPGRWSFAQNLDHLIKSATPVAKALAYPKLLLRVLFGRAGELRSYEQVQSAYKAKLNDGAQAPWRFVPQSQQTQEELLSEWTQCSQLLSRNLTRWNDSQLKTLRLPHPLLGKIAVAEMLFFTDLHTKHHLEMCAENSEV